MFYEADQRRGCGCHLEGQERKQEFELLPGIVFNTFVTLTLDVRFKDSFDESLNH